MEKQRTPPDLRSGSYALAARAGEPKARPTPTEPPRFLPLASQSRAETAEESNAQPEPLSLPCHVSPRLTPACRPVFAESKMLSRASRTFARGPLARQGEPLHHHRSFEDNAPQSLLSPEAASRAPPGRRRLAARAAPDQAPIFCATSCHAAHDAVTPRPSILAIWELTVVFSPSRFVFSQPAWPRPPRCRRRRAG